MRAALLCVVMLTGGCAFFRIDQIKIPHDKHQAAKVACLTCHESIYDAKTLEGSFLPDEKTCLQCHREQKEKGNCGFCHTEVRRAAHFPAPKPTLRIAHADHIERVKEDCSVCHKSLPSPLRTSETRPPMLACLSCHEHKKEYDEGRCRGCHLDLKKIPLKPVADFSHQLDWVREHGASARTNADSCAQCHDQTFCSDCHASTVSTKIEVKLPERVDEGFIHRNDYISRHTIEARAEPATCRRCHGSTFCESCHQAQNLTPFAVNPRDPHPAGWAFPSSANFHGPAARRDITSCAACHDQGARSICVDCHKVGGVGGNPHPLGWTDRHGRDEISRNNMCLACHQ